MENVYSPLYIIPIYGCQPKNMGKYPQIIHSKYVGFGIFQDSPFHLTEDFQVEIQVSSSSDDSLTEEVGAWMSHWKCDWINGTVDG